MTNTKKNLYEAFVGEAKAHLRLLGYAERAQQEGYPQIARLFTAIAEAEKIHALKHLRLLEIIGSTETNLTTSFKQEKSISENVYPMFIGQAEKDGDNVARISFSHARDAESVHAKLYKSALDHLIEERETSYYVCRICGYVVDGAAPETCPVCDVSEKEFFKVD